MQTIEKTAVPVIKDADGNPIAIILLIGRDRIIYTIQKADEDTIIELLGKNIQENP